MSLEIKFGCFFNGYDAIGACGYGSLALGFYGGHLAVGVPSLFKDGACCGACFQVCRHFIVFPSFIIVLVL